MISSSSNLWLFPNSCCETIISTMLWIFTTLGQSIMITISHSYFASQKKKKKKSPSSRWVEQDTSTIYIDRVTGWLLWTIFPVSTSIQKVLIGLLCVCQISDVIMVCWINQRSVSTLRLSIIISQHYGQRPTLRHCLHLKNNSRLCKRELNQSLKWKWAWLDGRSHNQHLLK